MPIRLSQIGRCRKWAECVANTGDRVPIVDDGGREVAWIIPALGPVTEAPLDELVRGGLWRRETLDMPSLSTHDRRLQHHRGRNVFVTTGTA
jgi:hypothetical protein